MATCMTENINLSPTRAFEVGGAVNPHTAVKLDASGKLVAAAAGDAAIGIALGMTEAGQDSGAATVQIAGVGYWEAGAAVAAGDLLAADANGCAVKAAEGKFIVAQALGAAAIGELVSAQIIKAGYAPAAG